MQILHPIGYFTVGFFNKTLQVCFGAIALMSVPYLSRTNSFTKFASNAPLLSTGVTSQSMLTTEPIKKSLKNFSLRNLFKKSCYN